MFAMMSPSAMFWNCPVWLLFIGAPLPPGLWLIFMSMNSSWYANWLILSVKKLILPLNVAKPLMSMSSDSDGSARWMLNVEFSERVRSFPINIEALFLSVRISFPCVSTMKSSLFVQMVFGPLSVMIVAADVVICGSGIRSPLPGWLISFR